MSDEPRFWFVDLVWLVVHVGLTAAVVLGDVPGALRVAVVVPAVLLVPGYSLVAALFPAGASRENVEWQAFDPGRRDTHADIPQVYGLTRVDRFALALVSSVAVVPLVAFVVNFTPFQLRSGPLLAAIGVPVVLLTVIAFVRRLRTPPVRRFSPFGAVPVTRDVESDGYRPLFGVEPASARDRLVQVIVGVSLLAFVASVTFAATTPPPADDRFTEAYLVAENDDGNLTTAAVPGEYTANRSEELVLGVVNNEYERTEYEVVVRLRRVENDSVTDGTELERFSMTLEHGETREHRHELRPAETGENLRITYFIYRNKAPADPQAADAYRVLRVDVAVQPADGGASSRSIRREPGDGGR